MKISEHSKEMVAKVVGKCKINVRYGTVFQTCHVSMERLTQSCTPAKP